MQNPVLKLSPAGPGAALIAGCAGGLVVRAGGSGFDGLAIAASLLLFAAGVRFVERRRGLSVRAPMSGQGKRGARVESRQTPGPAYAMAWPARRERDQTPYSSAHPRRAESEITFF